MKIDKLKKLAGLSLGMIALSACAPMQQPWNGQTYAGGGQQQPYGNQQAYGYGNQQPYGYGNQQPYGYGNQSAGPMSSALGTAAELALIGILTGQLGINQQQAMGGAGSIFQIAQQRMQPGDFSRLSAAVPGMDRYLAAAPQQALTNGSNNMWNGTGNMMGDVGSLMALAGSFQSLGMNADMIGRFVPVMLQYVEQQGGTATMSLLQNSLH